MSHFFPRTGRPTLFALSFLVLGVTSEGRPVHARQVLYVSNSASATVGEYNAVTGAPINSALIHSPYADISGLARDNNNHLFVASGSGSAVGLYNATTGAQFNNAYITSNVSSTE